MILHKQCMMAFKMHGIILLIYSLGTPRYVTFENLTLYKKSSVSWSPSCDLAKHHTLINFHHYTIASSIFYYHCLSTIKMSHHSCSINRRSRRNRHQSAEGREAS